MAPSLRLLQYSRASCPRASSLITSATCSFSSESSIPCSLLSVVPLTLSACDISKSGSRSSSFLRLLLLLPDESRLILESFCPLIRDIAPFAPLESIDPRGDRSDDKCIDGKMSFFCLLAGNISSRSTGTPKDTRKSLRIRDLSQSGGANGGGATSCEYNDKLRSDKNLLGGSSGADWEDRLAASGNNLFIYGCIASLRSSMLSISLQFIEGFTSQHDAH